MAFEPREVDWNIVEIDGGVMLQTSDGVDDVTLTWNADELDDARAFADAFYAALRKAGG